MLTDFTQNIPKFFCEFCEIKTNNKKDFSKHLLTSKHKKNVNLTHIEHIYPKNPIHNCKKCNKIYKSRVGLWYHEKKCYNKNTELINEEKIGELNQEITPSMILSVIQQNQEFKDLLIEQNKIIIEMSKNSQINNTINNNNNNSNNKTFNLQVFLNETCKDAMNIMDFVDSIKIQLSDIESIGELGYVNGMSKLIIKHLNALDENMRPVHCSDPKRDSLYVKDQNVWEKEDPDNKKIKKAIKYISHKNICALPEWRTKYPDCIYSDSLKSDQYNHIVLEAMGGSGDNDAEKADKIVKKIAKVVTINK
jgi:hypothetical protein